MTTEGNSPRRVSSLARPDAKLPAEPATSEKAASPGKRSSRPPKFSIRRIRDLLGNFSEQTGANFG